MADLFQITPAIRALSANAIDTMISQLGKKCFLAFDPQIQQCPNCYYDEAAKRSSGIYNGTGPRSFTHPPCPVCRGAGVIKPTGDKYEETTFLIDWQPKVWQYVDSTQTRIPQGIVMTKGYLTDMGKVIQCKYIIIDHANANYQNNRFFLWGEPTPSGNIAPNRYFVAFWSRSKGGG